MKKYVIVFLLFGLIIAGSGSALAFTVKVRNTTNYEMYVYVSVMKASLDEHSEGKSIAPNATEFWDTKALCPVRIGGKIKIRGTQYRMRTTGCRGAHNTGHVVPCCWNIQFKAERLATKSNDPNVVFDDDYGFTLE